MAARRTYIVTYDICDAKRLRKVFRTCRDFGDHLQYSVFECDLNPTEMVKLVNLLEEAIHHGEDQVLFIDLGPTQSRGDRTITALGVPYTNLDAPCFVL